MQIGPFNVRELETIRELLESRNIEFSVYMDKEMASRTMGNFNQSATSAPRYMAGKLDMKTVFFEIADEDFVKIAGEMEKYGIVPQSDGSYELGEDEE